MRIFVKDLHDMEGVARFDPTVTPKTIDYLHLNDSAIQTRGRWAWGSTSCRGIR